MTIQNQSESTQKHTAAPTPACAARLDEELVDDLRRMDDRVEEFLELVAAPRAAAELARNEAALARATESALRADVQPGTAALVAEGLVVGAGERANHGSIAPPSPNGGTAPTDDAPGSAGRTPAEPFPRLVEGGQP